MVTTHLVDSHDLFAQPGLSIATHVRLPICPVVVKPDGTSSSGGKTDVKISSSHQFKSLVETGYGN
jgi:hypothetical protein